MRSFVAAVVLGGAVLLPPVATRADAPARRTIERNVEAAPHVRIEDPVGGVRVVGDGGTTVRVTARIYAISEADAAAASVAVMHGGGESSVIVTVPHRARGVWGFFDRRRISVDLTVNVPRASGLAVRLKTGDADVAGMNGAIDASTLTGDLHLHGVAADAAATTKTGDIDVELTPRWNGMHLTAHTVTGDVSIRAPSGLRAHVVAQTHVGDVHNALGNSNVESPVIDLRSNVGDVTIATR